MTFTGGTGDDATEPQRRVYAKIGRYASRAIDAERVIVPVSEGVADLRAIYVVNDVAARVWELIDGARRVDAIVALLVDEYDVSQSDALRDVLALLDQLQAEGMVRA